MSLAVAHAVAVGMAAIGAATDFRTGHIPNWLTLPPIAAAPVVHGFTRGIWGLADSLAGILLCGFVPLLLFRKGAMHGGDVKLFAAIGAVVGWKLGLEAEMLALIVGAILSLGMLAWRGKLFRTLGNSLFLAINPLLPKKWRRDIEPELMSTIRLGVSIFAGTFLAVALRYQPLLL